MRRVRLVLTVVAAGVLSGGTLATAQPAAPTWTTEGAFGFSATGSLSDPVDTDEIAEQIVAYEARHEAAISTPAAQRERVDSVDAFADIGFGPAGGALVTASMNVCRD